MLNALPWASAPVKEGSNDVGEGTHLPARAPSKPNVAQNVRFINSERDRKYVRGDLLKWLTYESFFNAPIETDGEG